MKRVLIALVAAALLGFIALPSDAAFQTGTASNSVIGAGGDGGSAQQPDAFGDIVASYTSGAGNDTQYKTTVGQPDTFLVKAVFGDTTDMSGPNTQTLSPAATATFTIRVTNWSNVSDVIKIDNDTPTGASKDSMTIKVNGVIVYQGGTADTYAPYALAAIPPGAETQVTVAVQHQDTNGALGQTIVKMIAKSNNGVGGDPDGYVGNNGVSYAGRGDDSEVLTVTVNSINVLMSIGQDIVSVPASYNGGTGDSIPGSTITYVVRYDNDGNDTAQNFAVTVKIPNNTELSQADTSLCSAHLGSTVTVTVTDDSGTVVAVGPSATRVRWTFNAGVSGNNGDANGVVDASANDYDAGILKFKVYIK